VLKTEDGYTLEYYRNRNQIVIGLPQTDATPTNTLEMPSKRRVDVYKSELLLLLLLAKDIFKEEDDAAD